MSAVKDNIGPGWERAGSRSVQRDGRSVGWDDGGRVEGGSLNERRFKL